MVSKGRDCISYYETLLTISSSLEDVGLHGLLAVLGSDVALSGEEHLDVLLSSVQDGGESGRSHIG